MAKDLSHRLGIMEMAKGVAAVGEHGANQYSGLDKNKNIKSSEQGGTSSKYRISRLKRDHADVAACSVVDCGIEPGSGGFKPGKHLQAHGIGHGIVLKAVEKAPCKQCLKNQCEGDRSLKFTIRQHPPTSVNVH